MHAANRSYPRLPSALREVVRHLVRGPVRAALPIAGAGLAIVVVLGSTSSFPVLSQGVADAAGSCGLAQVAFCDTFDSPTVNPASSRSGDLNGVVWGVSHATSTDNPSQGKEYVWPNSTLNRCGTMVPVAPPRDVQICNGKLVESLSDQGAVAVLAMYPKQPFDIANRTGTVAFDVGNDTEGSHMAWPEFVYTDQPVPAPFEVSAGVADLARNSFGFQMAGDCKNGQLVPNGLGDSWAVNEMWITQNYAFNTRSFTMNACVKKGSQNAMNHIEVRMSAGHQEVWASDPGGSGFKLIATANIAMPLTHGLVWMEDIHYNAGKEPGTQENHTFAWDNFGFDGPIFPRDLAFDIKDRAPDNLGYLIPAGRPLDLSFTGVSSVAQASRALLVFTQYVREQSTVTYSMNGQASHTAAYPYGSAPTYVSQTIAIPVALTELQDGTNTLHLTSTSTAYGGLSVANFSLILVDAGGVVGGGGAPPTATPIPTSTATAVPTNTPIATTTAIATATAVPPTPVPNVPTPTPTPIGSSVLVGTQSVASDHDTNSAGEAQAFPYTASATGNATQLGIYLDASHSASRVTVGIYTNTSANMPGALLAQGALSNPVSGWNNVTVAGLNLTSGTRYWIAVLSPIGGTGSLQYRDQASTTKSSASQQHNLTALPATWTSGGMWPSSGISANAHR